MTFTLGSGGARQSCSGTTNAGGAASCTIADVNQTAGTVGVSASYSGTTYYQTQHGLDSDRTHSDDADGERRYQRLRRCGQVSAVLTNSITGAASPGSPSITLNS